MYGSLYVLSPCLVSKFNRSKVKHAKGEQNKSTGKTETEYNRVVCKILEVFVLLITISITYLHSRLSQHLEELVHDQPHLTGADPKWAGKLNQSTG